MEKLKFQHLAAMEFLLDDPEGEYRFAATPHAGFRDTEWYVVDGKNEDGKFPVRPFIDDRHPKTAAEKSEVRRRETEFADRLGGSMKVDFLPLIRSGFLKSGSLLFDKGSTAFVGKLADWRSDDRTTIHRVTAEGREWWNAEGRAIFEKERARREAAREAVGRRVLIGEVSANEVTLPAGIAARWPKNLRMPIPKMEAVRPAFTATVVKETAQRLYVVDVEAVNPDRKRSYSSVIQGRAPRQYVDRAHVMADHVTDDAVARLVAIDVEAREDGARACIQALEDMLPIVERMTQRTAQQDAMREDMIREVLDGLENDGGTGRRPK